MLRAGSSARFPGSEDSGDYTEGAVGRHFVDNDAPHDLKLCKTGKHIQVDFKEASTARDVLPWDEGLPTPA